MIDYLTESERYRPAVVRTLLIGEAPPPPSARGEYRYFYVPMKLRNVSIEADTSLPTTIFHHYFRTRPRSTEEYLSLLARLKQMGVFLVDICNEPIDPRNRPEDRDRIRAEIPRLRTGLAARHLSVPDTAMIFLLPRGGYVTTIKNSFPLATRVRWIDFRMNPEPLAS